MPGLHLTPDGFDHGVESLRIEPSPGTVGHDRLRAPHRGPAGNGAGPVPARAAELFQLDRPDWSEHAANQPTDTFEPQR
jgi:hypothetical protein